MPDQLDMQVRLAVRAIRQSVWEAKKRLYIPQIPLYDYLQRCEETEFEVVRSGTWSMVRYARKRLGRRNLTIILPDGSISW